MTRSSNSNFAIVLFIASVLTNAVLTGNQQDSECGPFNSSASAENQPHTFCPPLWNCSEYINGTLAHEAGLHASRCCKPRFFLNETFVTCPRNGEYDQSSPCLNGKHNHKSPTDTSSGIRYLSAYSESVCIEDTIEESQRPTVRWSKNESIGIEGSSVLLTADVYSVTYIKKVFLQKDDVHSLPLPEDKIPISVTQSEKEMDHFIVAVNFLTLKKSDEGVYYLSVTNSAASDRTPSGAHVVEPATSPHVTQDLQTSTQPTQTQTIFTRATTVASTEGTNDPSPKTWHFVLLSLPIIAVPIIFCCAMYRRRHSFRRCNNKRPVKTDDIEGERCLETTV